MKYIILILISVLSSIGSANDFSVGEKVFVFNEVNSTRYSRRDKVISIAGSFVVLEGARHMATPIDLISKALPCALDICINDNVITDIIYKNEEGENEVSRQLRTVAGIYRRHGEVFMFNNALYSMYPDYFVVNSIQKLKRCLNDLCADEDYVNESTAPVNGSKHHRLLGFSLNGESVYYGRYFEEYTVKDIRDVSFIEKKGCYLGLCINDAFFESVEHGYLRIVGFSFSNSNERSGIVFQKLYEPTRKIEQLYDSSLRVHGKFIYDQFHVMSASKVFIEGCIADESICVEDKVIDLESEYKLLKTVIGFTEDSQHILLGIIENQDRGTYTRFSTRAVESIQTLDN